MKNNNEIIIYQSSDGKVSVDVRMQDETVWLTQAQIAELFGKERSVITKHIRNILDDEELEEAVCANFAHTAQDGKTYETQYYNLDMIISVGYRVNSKRGVQFRRWSSSVLKEYLVKGYSLNQEKITSDKITELKQTLELLSTVLINQSLISDIGKEVIDIIQSYAKTWDLLLQYDESRLTTPKDLHKSSAALISYDDAKSAISQLKAELTKCNEASALFGLEREEALKSILGNLDQSFAGEDLYQSSEEKSANLLYFVIKNHPFTDGNKRIGCLLFLLFLKRSSINLNIVTNNSLTALALLIAESDPIQKELMIKLIMNLLVEGE
jgi:prophage maintenance system killer protein